MLSGFRRNTLTRCPGNQQQANMAGGFMASSMSAGPVSGPAQRRFTRAQLQCTRAGQINIDALLRRLTLRCLRRHCCFGPPHQFVECRLSSPLLNRLPTIGDCILNGDSASKTGRGTNKRMRPDATHCESLKHLGLTLSDSTTFHQIR